MIVGKEMCPRRKLVIHETQVASVVDEYVARYQVAVGPTRLRRASQNTCTHQRENGVPQQGLIECIEQRQRADLGEQRFEFL